jgi:hypothetical protein
MLIKHLSMSNSIKEVSKEMINAFQGLLRLALAVMAIFIAAIGYFSLDNKTVSGATCGDCGSDCKNESASIQCCTIIKDGNPTNCYKKDC